MSYQVLRNHFIWCKGHLPNFMDSQNFTFPGLCFVQTMLQLVFNNRCASHWRFILFFCSIVIWLIFPLHTFTNSCAFWDIYKYDWNCHKLQNEHQDSFLKAFTAINKAGFKKKHHNNFIKVKSVFEFGFILALTKCINTIEALIFC